jgi:hypothetical protein
VLSTWWGSRWSFGWMRCLVVIWATGPTAASAGRHFDCLGEDEM